MDITRFLTTAASGFAVQIPVLLVLLIGLVVAAIRFRSQRFVAAFALAALLLEIVLTLLSVLWTAILPALVTSFRWGTFQIGVATTVVGLLLSLLRAISWGLIIVAVFSRRTARPPLT